MQISLNEVLLNCVLMRLSLLTHPLAVYKTLLYILPTGEVYSPFEFCSPGNYIVGSPCDLSLYVLIT